MIGIQRDLNLIEFGEFLLKQRDAAKNSLWLAIEDDDLKRSDQAYGIYLSTISILNKFKELLAEDLK